MNSKDYLYDLFGCQGRKAIVTGASSGLGAELARVLVSAGADVLAVARRQERLEALVNELQDRAGTIHAHAADLSDNAAIAALPEQAHEQLGGCDILVANAGTATRVRLEDMAEQEFAAVVDLNLKAQWLLAKACFPLLRESGAGRIVNIASIAGKRGSASTLAYNAANFAMIGMTQSMAREFGPRGVNVNCVCPGAVDTSRMDQVRPDDRPARTRPGDPVNRWGSDDEVGEFVAFLCTQAASWIHGQSINQDGGAVMEH